MTEENGHTQQDVAAPMNDKINSVQEKRPPQLHEQNQPQQQQNFPPHPAANQHPRMRFPPQHGFPPPNGGPPGPGFPPFGPGGPMGFPPHMRPFPPFRPPPGLGPMPQHNNEPPPSFFNNPQSAQRVQRYGGPQMQMNMGGGRPQFNNVVHHKNIIVNGPPGMPGQPRGPPHMGGPRPPFPGFPGGPPGPGFRPPMGMPPFGPGGPGGMAPPQQLNNSQGQQQQQQPVNQTEKLKKLAGIPLDKELWIETKTGEGKQYFYHSETRETVWERPEPAKAVVMSQEELQKLVEEEKGQAAPGVNEAWQEFTAPDGRKYYFNYITQENTWTKPTAMMEREAMLKENGAAAMAAGFQAMMGASVAPAGIGYAGFRPSVATGGAQAALATSTGGQKDKSRPVSSTAVSGTPWCVVWTGDNRVFFYNPSTRTSVWERPPELYNRPDVDVLVSKPPTEKEQKAQKRRKKSSDDEEEEEEEEAEVEAVLDSDTSNSDNESIEPEKPVKKKTRQEKKAEKEKQKKEEQKKQGKQSLSLPIQQEKPVDPAIQAELEAQKEREKVPLEERIRQFRQLLEDTKVNATSTWGKELSKMVFDRRYLLLSAVERKAAFEAYCRERAEIAKEEKKKRSKEAKENFIKLLNEANLHGKSTFNSFSTKWSKDARFKKVEKNRDRETYFKEFVEELYKKEKEEKRKELEKVKEEFTQLLVEQSDLRRNSIWPIVKKKLEQEARYKNKNLNSEIRKKIFEEHVKTCPEPTEEEEEEAKRLVAEAMEASTTNEKRKEVNNAEESPNKEKEKKKKKKDKEKPEKSAEEKALEDRKREVEEELGEQLKERNREHERHKMQEHEQNFKALLTDLIKSTDISWHDARKQLKKDSRYENCELLEKDNKERMYREHIRDLERKKRDKFFQLLDEHQEITFNLKWHNAKKMILEDERFSKLKIDERKIEQEYRDWMERRYRQALDDFENLLRETKIITYKSKQMITENEQHLRDILAILENDKRYLVLKDQPNERERILDNYLETLDRKGPPPPPTRNEDPERRRK